MSKGHELKCVQCGGTELCFGYLGTSTNTFVPSGTFTIHGYRTRSYVCMNCGHLGHFISHEKLERLREKYKIEFEE